MPEGGLGGESELGEIVGIEDKDSHIFLVGFNHGDHALQRGAHGPVRLVQIRTWSLHVDMLCIHSMSHHLNTHSHIPMAKFTVE